MTGILMHHKSRTTKKNLALAIERDRAAMRMNPTELDFWSYLGNVRVAGHIVWARFEPWRFSLGLGGSRKGAARQSWYTPDFVAQLTNREIWIYEVKGHWREAAKVRIRAAATLYPMFRWWAVFQDKKEETGWRFEEF